MTNHPNKHIHKAIRYAMSKGWTIKKASARAHIWGTLRCPQHNQEGCHIRIMSTPRNPEHHENDICRDVDRYAHS